MCKISLGAFNQKFLNQTVQSDSNWRKHVKFTGATFE